jgi:hypothetical protein
MIESLVAAARLPQTDPDHAADIGQAEGQATLALLRALDDGDWTRPTDCTQWDVRTLLAHLVAQCEDSIRLGTMLRRQLLSRRRYPAKTALDAHMAVGVDDHRAASGPQLVERFALLWPAPYKPAGAGQEPCAASRSTPASLANRAGASPTCSTSSSTATCGCTGSTWLGQPGGRS